MSKKSKSKKSGRAPAKNTPPIEQNKYPILKIFNKPLFHFVLIVVLGFIIYSNTLNAPFIWDDNKLIVNNVNIRNLSNFTDLSGTRYLTYLSFALNYRINGYDVTGYHVFNIAVHIINAILVYLLVIMILKTPRFKESKISQLSSILALFSGLLFVSHPVYTMAVTNINQRSVPLATLFYLLSIVMYIKWRLMSDQQTSRPTDQQGKRRNYRSSALLFYCSSVLFAIFAMKCKEISFTLPIVIFIFDRYFFGKQYSFKKSVVYLIPILLTLLIIPLSNPQSDVFNQKDSTSFKIEDASVLSGLDAQKLSNIPRKVYMLTGLRVILTYIRLFFFPVDLNFLYDYPIYWSFSEPNVFLSFFLLLAIVILAVYFFMKARQTDEGRNLLISFGIIWFFINLSIESFGVVLGYVIFEYRLYLPSIGIILALIPLTGYLIEQASKTRRSLYVSALAAVVIIFPVATYSRNVVFKDEITFWEDVVKKSPDMVMAHNNLGNIYNRIGGTGEAIEEYKTALRLNPNDAYVLNNLGNMYAIEGRIGDAIEKYKAALKLNPNITEIRYNLGVAYRQKGFINEAIDEFRTVLKIQPDFAAARQNLESLKK
jgi:tetratricopeptide (TPR) repeat protein